VDATSNAVSEDLAGDIRAVMFLILADLILGIVSECATCIWEGKGEARSSCVSKFMSTGKWDNMRDRRLHTIRNKTGNSESGIETNRHDALVGIRSQQLGSDCLLDTQHHTIYALDTDNGATKTARKMRYKSGIR